MSAPPLTVPPPTDDDHEDVAWALRAASAQWRRQAVEDAVSWVKRAAETAHEVGAHERSTQLASLAIALASPLQAVAPPPPMSAAGVNAAAPPAAAPPAAAPPPFETPFAAAPPPVAPPLPPPHGAMASRPSIEVEEMEVDFDVDLDDDEIEMLDDSDGDVEMVEDVDGDLVFEDDGLDTEVDNQPTQAFEDEGVDDEVADHEGAAASEPWPVPALSPDFVPPHAQQSSASHSQSSHPQVSLPPRPSQPPQSSYPPRHASQPADSSRPPRSSRPEASSQAPVFDDLSSSPSTAPSERGTPSYRSTPSMRETASSQDSRALRARPSTSSGLDRLPPSMRPRPSGLDLAENPDDEEEILAEEFGELDFEEEATTSRVSLSSAPPVPDLGPISLAAPSHLPLEDSTAAEYAQSRAPLPSVEEHEELERELGVDLNLRVSARHAPVPPQISMSQAREPSISHADPLSPSSAPPGAIEHHSPIPGRASVRPSRPPGGSDRVTSGEVEPYSMAPSAQLPPVEELHELGLRYDAGRTQGKYDQRPPPIEPPSRPRTAPPPALMSEPEERPSKFPPSSIPGSVSSPALASAPEEDEFDEMFAAISRPPVALASSSSAASSPPISLEAPPPPLGEGPSVDGVGAEQATTIVDGLDVLELDGLQDLAEDAAAQLAASAVIVTLQRNEEVNDFGVALVTHGAVQMMPKVADAPCGVARKGEVLFTKGTLEETTQVRIVAAEDGTRVAIFTKEALAIATSESPWVADELAEVANRYLGFAGAVLGPLGDSLDDMFRFMVFEKCSVKAKLPGAIIATGGKAMDGMYILGGGSLEILAPDGSVEQELAMGDFVFPETILSAAPASRTVRVGAGGALVLYANRMAAHELLATCPPFIELLAG